MTIGPVIDDGFYYDFAFERPFTPEDLELIEQKMKSLVKAALPVERRQLTRAEALSLFSEMNEHYKVEIVQDLPEDESLSVYQQGDFVDLCRGPHLPNTSFIKAFKLTKCAGAYWRGDSSNTMLQRIYGTAWADKKSLNEYLKRLEEAKLRDHPNFGEKVGFVSFSGRSAGYGFLASEWLGIGAGY